MTVAKTKQKANCSYCGKDEFYIYHRKKYSKEELKDMPQADLTEMAKALGIQTHERERIVDGVFRMQRMSIDWAVCLDCMRKAMDKALGEAKDGGRIEHKEG